MPWDEIDPTKMNFEEFWETRCQFWGELVILLFYVGSSQFLLAVMIFMWSQFFFVYSSLSGAKISVILVGVGMILGFGTVLILRRIDTSLIRASTASKANNNSNNNNNAYDSNKFNNNSRVNSSSNFNHLHVNNNNNNNNDRSRSTNINSYYNNSNTNTNHVTSIDSTRSRNIYKSSSRLQDPLL
jgi:hypothetical protein